MDVKVSLFSKKEEVREQVVVELKQVNSNQVSAIMDSAFDGWKKLREESAIQRHIPMFGKDGQTWYVVSGGNCASDSSESDAERMMNEDMELLERVNEMPSLEVEVKPAENLKSGLAVGVDWGSPSGSQTVTTGSIDAGKIEVNGKLATNLDTPVKRSRAKAIPKEITESFIKTSDVHTLRKAVAQTKWMNLPGYSKLGANKLRLVMLGALKEYREKTITAVSK